MGDFASGKSTTINDRKVYLKNNPKNHRVLLRWELENYLYDKEVLQRYSKKHNLQFDESAYDQHVNDITTDNVKDKTGIMKNVCGISGSISVGIFKTELSKCITSEMTVYKDLHDCIFDQDVPD